MTDHSPSPIDDTGGWGHGLAAWMLAAYTKRGDTVVDLDHDSSIRMATTTMGRGILELETATWLAAWTDITLVTVRWPRPPASTVSSDPEPGSDVTTDRALLTEVSELLAPGGRLALLVSIPTPTQPFTLYTAELLAAAFDAGLGHLRAVHGVAIVHRGGFEPTYGCALVFRRPGRRTNRRLIGTPHSSPEASHG
jgi:hypothetical protein